MYGGRHVASLLVLLIPAASLAATESESWYPVAVDHVRTNYNALVYVDDTGDEYVRQLDLDELNIPVSAAPPHRHAGEWYYPAHALPMHEVRIDDVGGYLHIVERVRPHIETPPSSDLLLDVTVNHRRLDEPLLLHFRHGEIVFSEDALIALGVDAEHARLLLRDDDALPVHALAGEHFAIDYGALTLDMQVPPQLFLPVVIDVSEPTAAPDRPAGGISAILSYDVTTGVSVDDERWKAGLFELAAGGSRFTCTSRHVRAAFTDDLRRLDTHCVRDWPQHPLSLNVGDAISRPGIAGQPVRYGGLRFGTDYALAPYYVTQPGLSLLGSARVPSTLEVWVDQMLVLRRDVLPGVFDLTGIPVHTGAGEVRAVITNALGVREVISQPFYSDPALLVPGLVDWGIELGRVRDDYALESDSYGDRFALFDLSYGMTDWLTISPRLEALEDARIARFGAAVRIGRLGVVEAEHAVSELDSVRGSATTWRFSRRGRYANLSLARTRSDDRFVQLGYPEPGDTPHETSQASVGVALGPLSLNVGGFRRVQHDGERQHFHTAAMTIPVGRVGSLLLTAFEPVDPADERLYSLNLTIPIGYRGNVGFNGFSQGETQGWEAVAQRSLPSGPGVGYRVAHGEIDGSSTDSGQLYAQNNLARIGLDARRTEAGTIANAGLAGSIIASRGGVNLSRWQTGSAAVVTLPAPGVRIYHEERLAAVTDSDGSAVVPGLRPYETNRIRAAIEDLPLSVDVRSLEAELVPGRRQAVPVEFSVRKSHHVTARLLRAESGTPVPAGATAHIVGDETLFPIGFDGLVYVTVPSLSEFVLEVQWPQGSCRTTVAPSPTDATIIDAGELRCE